MTILQYLSAFRLFGGDVLVLGLAVTIAVSVLKKTALKNAPKKLFVFLPFALGTIVFAAFRCLAELSAAPLTSDLAATFEGGFACGCAATLYYVVYEQFLRVKQSAAGNAENAATSENAAAANTGSAENAAAENAPTDGARSAEETVRTLLKTFVSAETAEEAAKALSDGYKAMTKEAFGAFVSETIARFAPALGDEARSAAATMVENVFGDKAKAA